MLGTLRLTVVTSLKTFMLTFRLPFVYNVLRQVNSDYRQGFTFNRCSVDTPGYLPESFMLGFPSPNRENDCMGPQSFFEDDMVQPIEANEQVP